MCVFSTCTSNPKMLRRIGTTRILRARSLPVRTFTTWRTWKGLRLVFGSIPTRTVQLESKQHSSHSYKPRLVQIRRGLGKGSHTSVAGVKTLVASVETFDAIITWILSAVTMVYGYFLWGGFLWWFGVLFQFW